VLGGAVVRNRLKRRLREAVRLHGMIPAAMDVVINPKKSLLTAGFVDVQREIRRAFEVIGKAAGKS
jgi:ribonuclease P protein component